MARPSWRGGEVQPRERERLGQVDLALVGGHLAGADLDDDRPGEPLQRQHLEELRARLAPAAGHEVLVLERAEPVGEVDVRAAGPERGGHRHGVGAGRRGVRQVEGDVVVGLRHRVPVRAGRPRTRVCRARHGNMFSTASAMPVSCSRSATPSTNSPAYSFCQRNGGCSTTVDAADLLGQGDRVVDLGPGVGSPDALGEQERGRVHRHHGYAVQLGQCRERPGLLRDGVGPDHHLERRRSPGGPRSRRRRRTCRGRPRRSREPPWPLGSTPHQP